VRPASRCSAQSEREEFAMAEGFIGEIRMVGFPYAPERWLNADGQMLPIDQYQALFSLYGTIYGGNGRTTFGIPDFRGRVPIHEGRGPGLPEYQMGQNGGVPDVTLMSTQAPVHTHPTVVNANKTGASVASPEGAFWGSTGRPAYETTTDAVMNPDAVQVGENQGGDPHENMQPYLTVRFCICIDGQYPPRP